MVECCKDSVEELEQVGEVEPESDTDVSPALDRSMTEISSASVSPSSAFNNPDLASDSSLCPESIPMLSRTPFKAEETASKANRSRSNS